MYKGLKPELEEIVNQLEIGDSILIEHTLDYSAKESIGFVYGKGENTLNLINKKNHRINHETNDYGIGPLFFCKYGCIENIKIVNPVKRK